VDSAVAIAVGDILYFETDAVEPAGIDSNADGTGDLWNTNIATTQEAVHDLFAGVALSRSQVGETDPVRVATGGVFEFDCAAATFELGVLVGVAKTSGDNVENQKVVAVATANLAIGRVAKRYAANTTKVWVEIISVVTLGGPQAAE
jgi:hypothetical protein